MITNDKYCSRKTIRTPKIPESKELLKTKKELIQWSLVVVEIYFFSIVECCSAILSLSFFPLIVVLSKKIYLKSDLFVLAIFNTSFFEATVLLINKFINSKIMITKNRDTTAR